MKKLLYIVSTVVLLMGLVACGNNKTEQTNTKTAETNQAETTNSAKGQTGEDIVSKIKSEGKIVLGTSADYPPYESHKTNGSNDEIVGIDIEIAKAIAEHLGVELEIKDMSFDGLIAALNVGEMDFVLSGMAASEERKEAVDFSIPYQEQAQVLLVRTEDADKYKTVDDLKGLKVGVQLGTTQETYAQDNFKESELQSIQSTGNLVMELKNKTFDVVFMSKVPADKFAQMQEGLAVVDAGLPNEPGFSVAIKKGNTELVNEVNTVISKLQSEGKIQSWIDQYSQETGE